MDEIANKQLQQIYEEKMRNKEPGFLFPPEIKDAFGLKNPNESAMKTIRKQSEIIYDLTQIIEMYHKMICSRSFYEKL